MKSKEQYKSKKRDASTLGAELSLSESMLLAQEKSVGNTVLLIRGRGMGEGDPEFGEHLLQTYFRALQEMVDLQGTVILYQEGVKVLQEEHPARATLLSLIRPGLDLRVCRRSLNHYKIANISEEKVIVSSMMDIACCIDEADKVITL